MNTGERAFFSTPELSSYGLRVVGVFTLNCYVLVGILFSLTVIFHGVVSCGLWNCYVVFTF
jgi:hypothetical protein